jgi:hypothetical protein
VPALATVKAKHKIAANQQSVLLSGSAFMDPLAGMKGQQKSRNVWGKKEGRN